MIRTVEVLLLGFALGVMLGVPAVYWLSFERRLSHRVSGRTIDLTGAPSPIERTPAAFNFERERLGA